MVGDGLICIYIYIECGRTEIASPEIIALAEGCSLRVAVLTGWSVLSFTGAVGVTDRPSPCRSGAGRLRKCVSKFLKGVPELAAAG